MPDNSDTSAVPRVDPFSYCGECGRPYPVPPSGSGEPSDQDLEDAITAYYGDEKYRSIARTHVKRHRQEAFSDFVAGFERVLIRGAAPAGPTTREALAEWLEDNCHDADPRFWYEVVKPIVRSLRDAVPPAGPVEDAKSELLMAIQPVNFSEAEVLARVDALIAAARADLLEELNQWRGAARSTRAEAMEWQARAERGETAGADLLEAARRAVDYMERGAWEAQSVERQSIFAALRAAVARHDGEGQ